FWRAEPLTPGVREARFVRGFFHRAGDLVGCSQARVGGWAVSVGHTGRVIVVDRQTAINLVGLGGAGFCPSGLASSRCEGFSPELRECGLQPSKVSEARQYRGEAKAPFSCALPYQSDTVEHMMIVERLIERAAERHGYVITRDARDLGIDPTQLRILAARGRLERVARGVYRVPILPRGE